MCPHNKKLRIKNMKSFVSQFLFFFRLIFMIPFLKRFTLIWNIYMLFLVFQKRAFFLQLELNYKIIFEKVLNSHCAVWYLNIQPF